MIVNVLRLTLWEWFKLRLRWMPWILLVIAIVIGQIGVWASYTAYHNESVQGVLSGGTSSFSEGWEEDGETFSISMTCIDIINGNIPEELEELDADERRDFLQRMEEFREESCANTAGRDEFREAFALPSAISGGLSGAVAILPILIMILAASAAGSEYGWGTLRTVLTRGTGRWQLLSSKLLVLLVMVAAGLVVIGFVHAVSSVVANVIPPAETGGLADSGEWSEIAVTFGKVVYGMVPYIVLGTFLAVLTQSTAVGISISLGYYVVELILAPVLGLVDWLQDISDFLLGQNVNYWMAQAGAVTVEVTGDGAPAPDLPPDATQAFFVLLVYVVVIGAATFWLFRRRDIAGAKGG